MIIQGFKDGVEGVVLQHFDYARRDLDWFLHW
jgi:hypothetical protein